MKVIKVFFILFVFFLWGCSRVTTKARSSEHQFVRLQYTIKPYSILGFELWSTLKPEVKEWKILAGKYESAESIFQIAVYDVNGNGIYSDVGVDRLLLSNSGSKYCQYNTDISSSVSTLKRQNIVKVDDNSFCIEITSKDKLIKITKVNDEEHNSDIVFFSKLPDLPINFLGGRSSSLNEIINGQTTRLEFWAPWCIPCMERIDQLNDKGNDSIETILVLGEGSVDQAKERLGQINNKLACIISPSLNKIFDQNGYPYEVIVESDGRIRK